MKQSCRREADRVPEGHYLQWVNACLPVMEGETSSPIEYTRGLSPKAS